ncbi:MAG: YIP1 family protein [Candidatus Eisenbacteria bacterium]|nr:YIP1 family protein [Candidatus Eisenbacteria bacterium]
MSSVGTLNAGGGTGGFVGSLGRAFRVLFAPTQVFTELERKPEWLAPVVICILVAVLSSIILVPSVILPHQRQLMEERGLTEEQLEAARPWLESGRTLIIAVVTSVVGTPIVLLIVAGVFHLVCGLLLRGQANFMRTFSVAAFAWMVSLPEAIVKVPLALASKSPEVQTGLGLLMARDQSAGFGYRFVQSVLSNVDIFTLWKVVLLALGVAVMFKFTRRKSYYATGGIWLVYVLLASAAGSIIQLSTTGR